MRIRSFTAPAVLVTGALLLSACGGDSPLEGRSGDEVIGLAADALEEAGAVHMAGTLAEGDGEAEIDLQLQGDDAAGSVTIDGVELELINVGGEFYLKATEEVLTSFGQPAAAIAEVEGKWLQLPPEAAADFADFTLDGFIAELRDPGEVDDETRSGELDGDPVVRVGLGEGSTLTVKDDDPAYPLEMGDDEGSVVFSNHGEKQDISAPDDVIDFAEVVDS